MFVCPDVFPPPSAQEASILSGGASKHVDFSLARAELAAGAPGVNELMFNGEVWRGGREGEPSGPRSDAFYALEEEIAVF